MVAFIFLVGAGIFAIRLALGGADVTLSGGIPFLPHGMNQAVGRGVMGISGLACLALAMLAFRDVRGPRP